MGTSNTIMAGNTGAAGNYDIGSGSKIAYNVNPRLQKMNLGSSNDVVDGSNGK